MVLKELLEADSITSEVLRKSNRLTLKNGADVFALCFLSNINVTEKRFLLKESKFQDAFPWRKTMKQFLKDVRECADITNLHNIRKYYQGFLPLWFPHPPKHLETGKNNLQLIAMFGWFLEDENLVRLFQNTRILNGFSDDKSKFSFHYQQSSWKYIRNKSVKDVMISADLAVLPTDQVRHLKEMFENNHSFKDLYLKDGFREFKTFQQKFQHNFENLSEGVFIDLAEIVKEIQDAYFPEMSNLTISTWGQKYSTRLLASYNPSTELVSMSLIFDLPCIDTDIVRYIIYHELLHKKLGVIKKNGRHFCHTPEFRHWERRFPNADKLEKEITKLVRNPYAMLDFNKKLKFI